MELLAEYEVPLQGARAVVVGRSNIVGKPISLLLLAQHATVTVCHSRTQELGTVTREADVLVAAIGRAEAITPDMVKPGATVIDVGINRVDGRLVGDVRADVAECRRSAHARARWGRADDDRVAPPEHGARRPLPGRAARLSPGLTVLAGPGGRHDRTT